MRYSLFLLMLTMATQLSAQKEIPLYTNGVPNQVPCQSTEATNNYGSISGITQPRLYEFQPLQKDSLKTAVLIIPGGGYAQVAIQHEGFDVAKAFNQKGIAAFVLKYRTPKDSACHTNRETVALQDAQQAIKIIREQAAALDINPILLGVMGFSAGGHLTATTATHYTQVEVDNPLQTDLRPSFIVLAYPVISFQDSLTHMGSRNNTIGKNPSQAKKDYYSNELQVTPQTPPTFLMHAADDKTVKVENSLLFFDALLKNKVPAEMHILQKGGHGFGLNNKAEPSPWLPQVFTWMKANKFMKGNVTTTVPTNP